jgi:hypothetical protein
MVLAALGGSMRAQYSIELIEQGSGGVLVEHILARESDLDAARAFYRFCTRQFPNRIFLLADRARVLDRSDYP